MGLFGHWWELLLLLMVGIGFPIVIFVGLKALARMVAREWQRAQR